MAEWVVIGILVSLLIAQQVQIQKLMNKLMSRNYQEYAQSLRLKKPSNVSKTSGPATAVFDPIAERNATEANKLFVS